MKVAGIIAEYNPFHGGHQYHIRQTKHLSGCDFVVAVMSGNYVQRGAPAIIDKHTRAEMALAAGVDLVLELPLYAATASAEQFAEGGIRALSDLSLVDTVSFGSEIGALEPLQAIADVLIEEPPVYRERLLSLQKEGHSYAKASALALHDCVPKAAVFDTPNNLLAVEYLRALRRIGAPLVPLTVKREGASYHSTGVEDAFPSATALRAVLSKNPEQFPFSTLPPELCRLYQTAFFEGERVCCLTEDDFSDLLFFALLRAEHAPNTYFDVSEELFHRLRTFCQTPQTFQELSSRLKTKNRTKTGIDRALLHLMLDLTQEENDRFRALPHLPYLRVLGIRSRALSLLGELSTRSAVPLLCRHSDVAALSPQARVFYQREASADALYRQILYRKTGRLLPDDSNRRLLIYPQ